MAPLLSSKRFLPLFITQFLGAFNDNMFKNALLILLIRSKVNKHQVYQERKQLNDFTILLHTKCLINYDLLSNYI
jgi:hypothetical protein